MDEIVKAALRKWPNVPHCHGWLALCARGHWYLRDEGVQAAGPFPQAKGSRITHDKLLAFIHRNYAADEHGAWYFQNGPQRVYVTLEAAPFVWRLQALPEGGALQVTAQTGAVAQPLAVWLDEDGRPFLHTDLGFGLVHSLDTALLAEALDDARAGALGPVQQAAFSSLPARFNFVLRPGPSGP